MLPDGVEKEALLISCKESIDYIEYDEDCNECTAGYEIPVEGKSASQVPQNVDNKPVTAQVNVDS